MKDISKQPLSLMLSLLTTILFSCAIAHAGENACGPVTPAEEQLIKLQVDNEILALKIKQLESVKALPLERLHNKKIIRLREIATSIKAQRQTTSVFEGFVTWMSANLAGYNRYIQAGSYAAVVAKMLPIPYAGQASIFTKFVSQFTVALNASSVAVTNYLNSSRKFIMMVEAIDSAKVPDEKMVAEAALFADRQVLKDVNDAQAKLNAVSDLSSGALSFLESLNHYVSGTDEYWNKAKGLFKKDIDPREKSFISESTNSLKVQANRFNGRLRSFEEFGKKETVGIKALSVYDELVADIASSK